MIFGMRKKMNTVLLISVGKPWSKLFIGGENKNRDSKHFQTSNGRKEKVLAKFRRCRRIWTSFCSFRGTKAWLEWHPVLDHTSYPSEEASLISKAPFYFQVLFLFNLKPLFCFFVCFLFLNFLWYKWYDLCLIY